MEFHHERLSLVYRILFSLSRLSRIPAMTSAIASPCVVTIQSIRCEMSSGYSESTSLPSSSDTSSSSHSLKLRITNPSVVPMLSTLTLSMLSLLLLLLLLLLLSLLMLRPREDRDWLWRTWPRAWELAWPRVCCEETVMQMGHRFVSSFERTRTNI